MKTTRIIFIFIFTLSLIVLGYDFFFPRISLASSTISIPDGTATLDPSITAGVVRQFRMTLVPFIALSSACLLSWLFLGRRLVSLGCTLIGIGLAIYFCYFSYQDLLGYTTEQKLSGLFSGRGLMDLGWIAIHLISLLIVGVAAFGHGNNQGGEQGDAVEAV